MHEYGLVQALLDRVEAEARAHGATTVHRVVVRVGELSGVDPELFSIAYETFRQGSLCAKTPLELERVPAAWACPTCEAEVPRGAVLRCPACGVPARLCGGADELQLRTIDMEVP